MDIVAARLKTRQRDRLTIYDTPFRKVWLGLLAVALVLFPQSASRYSITIATGIALAVIGAVATNILIGVAGQASIGNAAFMAIGAFSATVFGIDWHLPFVVVVLASGVVGALVGLLVGIPAFRLRGMYLVIATLALHFVVLYLVHRYQVSRVGPSGFIMPEFRLGSLSRIDTWYYLLTFGACISLLIMTNLLRSRFGRVWGAIGQEEIAADILGVSVKRQKLLVFALTSFIIAAQGAMFAYYLGVATSEAFTFDLAVQYIAIIVIGGSGSVLGSVFGAAFVVGLPYAVIEVFKMLPHRLGTSLTGRLFDIQTIIYGVAIVI